MTSSEPIRGSPVGERQFKSARMGGRQSKAAPAHGWAPKAAPGSMGGRQRQLRAAGFRGHQRLSGSIGLGPSKALRQYWYLSFVHAFILSFTRMILQQRPVNPARQARSRVHDVCKPNRHQFNPSHILSCPRELVVHAALQIQVVLFCTHVSYI